MSFRHHFRLESITTSPINTAEPAASVPSQWPWRGGKRVLTVIVKVPARLLYGVTVGRGVGRWWWGQVWSYAAHGHSFPVSMHRLGVESTEFWMLWDGGAFERIAVKIVSRVTWNARSVGDGADRHLGWYVGVNILVQLRIEIRSL